jgi:2-oxoglutarate/2-oxoacid ferredoxin oxidoreductase subunit beta
VLQVCVTYYNMYEYYDQRVYELVGHNPQDLQLAMDKARQWDYNKDAKIGLGVFYQKEMPSFEEYFPKPASGALDRIGKIKEILSRR